MGGNFAQISRTETVENPQKGKKVNKAKEFPSPLFNVRFTPRGITRRHKMRNFKNSVPVNPIPNPKFSPGSPNFPI